VEKTEADEWSGNHSARVVNRVERVLDHIAEYDIPLTGQDQDAISAAAEEIKRLDKRHEDLKRDLDRALGFRAGVVTDLEGDDQDDALMWLDSLIEKRGKERDEEVTALRAKVEELEDYLLDRFGTFDLDALRAHREMMGRVVGIGAEKLAGELAKIVEYIRADLVARRVKEADDG
jgi:hypothetical protein